MDPSELYMALLDMALTNVLNAMNEAAEYPDDTGDLAGVFLIDVRRFAAVPAPVAPDGIKPAQSLAERAE